MIDASVLVGAVNSADVNHVACHGFFKNHEDDTFVIPTLAYFEFQAAQSSRAAELKNVAAACREVGISRTLFYRWRRRFERYGRDGLYPRRRQARPGRPPQVPPHLERLVVGQALAWPTWGCRRVSRQLGRDLGVAVSPSTVQRILRRAGLGRRRERLALLEPHSVWWTTPPAVAYDLFTRGTSERVCPADGTSTRKSG